MYTREPAHNIPHLSGFTTTAFARSLSLFTTRTGNPESESGFEFSR